ncbi:carboxypeptidase-like regulatory domain-containing protein [Mucilaginibacter sp.]|uniref:carboxypeptidase-like regulatory domain-containing protein n=1 Tax=Mucilaginibacter sp. TaxID=1882438 RepID=UPI00260AD6D3|nr:carboxypeptidase-like regulatory domain-containing protein [Mucilaginibacter sp.]MDB5029839.1 hypothetical protein [Mucilaginibacter sp.]
MKKLVCILLVFIAFNVKAQTYSINGTVTDEKGEAVSGATVFITNSSYITSTDNKGKFGFNGLQPGGYEVVIKMLGLAPVTQEIKLQEKNIHIVARLAESTIELNTVTIKGKTDYNTDLKREKYLALFLKSFIGETVNAEQCKLLNPAILNFYYDRDKGVLLANADDFLVVENKALGYKLKYLLTEFAYDYNTNLCTIGGSPYFEELKGTDVQKKKWEVNRKTAYLSSGRHFFKAVMNNTAKTEGYIVAEFVDRPLTSKYGKTLVADRPLKIDSVFSVYNKNFRVLLPGIMGVGKDTVKLSRRFGLYVAYNGVKASPLFYKTGTPLRLKIKSMMKDPQESEIQLLADTIMIDRNGELSPNKKAIFSGYWGWLRIADLMPLDYFVDPLEGKK